VNRDRRPLHDVEQREARGDVSAGE
jgi:hypothetical protein